MVRIQYRIINSNNTTVTIQQSPHITSDDEQWEVHISLWGLNNNNSLWEMILHFMPCTGVCKYHKIQPDIQHILFLDEVSENLNAAQIRKYTWKNFFVIHINHYHHLVLTIACYRSHKELNMIPIETVTKNIVHLRLLTCIYCSNFTMEQNAKS